MTTPQQFKEIKAVEKIVNCEIAMPMLVLAKHCFVGKCLLARVKVDVERK